MTMRFKDLHSQTVKQQLQQKFNYENPHQIPEIEKVVLNMGVGEGVADAKALNNAQRELTLISGQKAIVTKAKRSIAGFKLRQGMKIGAKVTLRNDRMYEFLERLVYVALPRTTNFSGFSIKSFDNNGNFNTGISEHIVFPEIDYDKVDKVKGLNITIVTSAKTSEEAKELLAGYNIPFKK